MGFSFGKGPTFGKGPAFAGSGPLGDPADDPLAGVVYTDDLEVDAAAELTAMEQAYRDRASAEAKRFVAATDSEYWFAVCFVDRDEKDAFLAEFAPSIADDKYLDGRALARALRAWRAAGAKKDPGS